MLKNQMLFDAVVNNNVAQVKIALDEGADVNAKAKNSATPLLIAADRGHTEIASILIDASAKLEAKSIGQQNHTPLLRAIVKGHTETASLLIKSGASIEAENSEGKCILRAVEFKNTEIIKMLIEYGVEVNVVNLYGSTPLSLASALDLTEVVQMIEDHSSLSIIGNEVSTIEESS